MKEYIHLGDRETELLKQVYQQGGLSARGYFKVLRLARTIADLAGQEEIRKEDLVEALFFRNAGAAEEGGDVS